MSPRGWASLGERSAAVVNAGSRAEERSDAGKKQMTLGEGLKTYVDEILLPIQNSVEQIG